MLLFFASVLHLTVLHRRTERERKSGETWDACFPSPVITYEVVSNTDRQVDRHTFILKDKEKQTDRRLVGERDRNNILGYRETLYMCLSIRHIHIYTQRDKHTYTHVYTHTYERGWEGDGGRERRGGMRGEKREGKGEREVLLLS